MFKRSPVVAPSEPVENCNPVYLSNPISLSSSPALSIYQDYISLSICVFVQQLSWLKCRVILRICRDKYLRVTAGGFLINNS